VAARVSSVGVIATIFNIENPEPPEGSVNRIQALLRPFAKLTNGYLATVGSPVTIGVVPDRFDDELEARAIQSMRMTALPSEHRRAWWDDLLAELKNLGIQTDPETLMVLDFDFVPDGELRGRLAREAGH
jgi:hypothetical protein